VFCCSPFRVFPALVRSCYLSTNPSFSLFHLQTIGAPAHIFRTIVDAHKEGSCAAFYSVVSLVLAVRFSKGFCGAGPLFFFYVVAQMKMTMHCRNPEFHHTLAQTFDPHSARSSQDELLNDAALSGQYLCAWFCSHGFCPFLLTLHGPSFVHCAVVQSGSKREDRDSLFSLFLFVIEPSSCCACLQRFARRVQQLFLFLPSYGFMSTVRCVPPNRSPS